MRPFIIDNNIREQLSKLADYAEAHIMSMDDLMDIINGDEKLIAGNNPEHTITLPFGYRVVLSLEDQPAGIVRHLSVFLDKPYVYPSPTAVQAIMDMLRFTKDLDNCIVSIVELGNGLKAIDVKQVT